MGIPALTRVKDTWKSSTRYSILRPVRAEHQHRQLPPPDDHHKINVPTPKIYEHKETFESNYEVDLTKYDYETGKELKDSTWQVLEAFPDQTQLSDSEEDGGLLEKKMREAPTTWNEWLIFETDLKTDTNGYLKHH